MALTDCWYLTGPTAVGKTEIGLLLARRIGAEIVSLDSMALYRHMDIGTAKPTDEQQAEVAHHLIDILDPHETFSLAQYIDAARRCVGQIRNRGHQVLFVGGTPLYLKGLLRGIFEGPPADWPFRQTLHELAEREGADILHQRLAKVDPVAAERLHPNDTRRLIRALEVFQVTGKPISSFQKQFETGLPVEQCRVFVLSRARPELHERINQRVDQMFAAGLIDETRQLLDAAQPLSKTARQALGYREVVEHLQGKRNLPETVELVKQRTRQFAKRQGTWFRSLSECRHLTLTKASDAVEVVGSIEELGKTVASPDTESFDRD